MNISIIVIMNTPLLLSNVQFILAWKQSVAGYSLQEPT